MTEDQDENPREGAQKVRNPSPAEIAAACLEIQKGWSDSERLGRLRSDWRPEHPEMLGGGSPMTRAEGVRHLRGVRSNEKHLERLREQRPEKLPPVWLMKEMDIEFSDDDDYQEFDSDDDDIDDDLDSESEVSELPPVQPAAGLDDDDDDEPDEPTQEQTNAEILKRLEDEHAAAQQAYQTAFRSAMDLLRQARLVKADAGIPPRDSDLYRHLARDDTIAPLNQRVQTAWANLKQFRDSLERQTRHGPDSSEMVFEDDGAEQRAGWPKGKSNV